MNGHKFGVIYEQLFLVRYDGIHDDDCYAISRNCDRKVEFG